MAVFLFNYNIQSDRMYLIVQAFLNKSFNLSLNLLSQIFLFIMTIFLYTLHQLDSNKYNFE
ncbi:MAG: hypothetical protein CXT78_07155 [Thaumarchaeota archaeon]|nr:MAG: hypothetical protein CXT78_07155 [Nitrososphaerota archaeon]